MVQSRYKKTRKHFLALLLIFAVASTAFRGDLFLISKNLDIFTSLYKELNINYVDEVNSSGIIKTGIDAMLNDLDPYTEYVPESDIEDYKLKYVSTQYGGIGASVMERNKGFFVSEAFAGFPAQKADIRAGDEFIQINGVSLKGKTNEEVSQLLKGPKNTAIKIFIKRPGTAKLLEKSLFRDEIIHPNVSYYGMLEGKIGYIRLDKFLENSGQEVKDALADLQKQKAEGLILDLRYNGGGILQEAVKIVNLFVDKDVVVVTQKGRNKEKTISYKTGAPSVAPGLPLAVLVNGRSASAAEIVAGSLQDLDRAVVIGQRSYGKGLVQQTFNLPYNSLVKVTVAKYYTPSGRCIQSLDYTHRNADGAVEKVADSLITEYKTKGGRSVYDGSGIYPDIYVKTAKPNLITLTLASKYHIFDYATNYRNRIQAIANPKQFRLSDGEYEEFVKYLSGKDYNYNTATERILNELKKEAERENKLPEISAEFDALKSKVSHSKRNDLIQFKDEISRTLENEIVSRYYFQKGRVENGFKYDEELNSALKVLGNKTTLASILQGHGTFGSIGKPGADFAASASLTDSE